MKNSTDSTSLKSEDNCAKLVAYLLDKYDLNIEDNLFTHSHWLNYEDGVRGSNGKTNPRRRTRVLSVRVVRMAKNTQGERKMNKEQQELYEKLLKKVNEYCLGYAAEDVIAAIDNLVDSYEIEEVKMTEALTILKKHLEPKLFQCGKFYLGITIGQFHASYEVLRKEWHLLKEIFNNE